MPTPARGTAAKTPLLGIEWRIIRALASCTFAPASAPKRFVRQMAGVLERPPEEWVVTERQREWRWALLHSYRRQIPDFHRETCCCELKRARRVSDPREDQKLARWKEMVNAQGS